MAATSGCTPTPRSRASSGPVDGRQGRDMKALVFDGEQAAIRDDVDVRQPGPTEVRVRVTNAGLCHSDLSVIDKTIPWPSPAVLGHEGAGIVDEVGEAVTNVQVGDHVV